MAPPLVVEFLALQDPERAFVLCRQVFPCLPVPVTLPGHIPFQTGSTDQAAPPADHTIQLMGRDKFFKLRFCHFHKVGSL